MESMQWLVVPFVQWLVVTGLVPSIQHVYDWRHCFDQIFTREGCCRDKQNESCWNDVLTYDNCCSAFNAAPFMSELTLELFPFETEIPPSREAIYKCVQEVSLPALDLALYPGNPFASYYKLVDSRGYAKTLGRVLFCTGLLPSVKNVLDVFLGKGGFAFHVLRGLRYSGGGYLMGFEMREEVMNVTQEILAPAFVHSVPADLYSFREGLLGLPDDAHTILLHGRTYITNCSSCHGRPNVECFHFCPLVWSPVDVVCEVFSPDLVVWDGTSDTGVEWIVIEHVCKPKYVFVMNVGIPDQGGWIVHRLRALGWAVVAEGVVGYGEEDRLPGQRDYFRLRGWVLLERLWDL